MKTPCLKVLLDLAILAFGLFGTLSMAWIAIPHFPPHTAWLCWLLAAGSVLITSIGIQSILMKYQNQAEE